MNLIFGLLFFVAIGYYLKEGFKMKPKDPEDAPKWWWFVNWNRDNDNHGGDNK
ncbi:hypothetical protein D3C74_270760 [compost metagenome]